MFSAYKLVPLLVLSFHLSFCNCNVADFQANIDGFMNAFDDAYSTEVITQTTDEMPIGNDVISETLALEEGSSKEYEEAGAVQEEPVVTETVFQPGSEIRHEINEDLVKMAARAVASISPDLELVNITEAVSMVTDKVERSFSLRVAQRNCEGDCSVACRVDLVSHGDEETVTWHNCLETNEVPRIKRGAVGGFKQVDEAEAMELAEIAAQTLDTIDADDVKRVVTQVIRAQKQLVNGIMYHLTLEMAMSDCKEDVEKCTGKLGDYNICKILMQRLFSGDAPRNAQVIKSECNPISKAKDIESKKQEQKRAKRHVAVDGTESNMIINHNHVTSKKSFSHDRVLGGRTRQDPSSDKIKEISEFALAEIDKSSNSLNKQKIVRVVDARSQVVAGVKYFLKMELVETNCRKGSDHGPCSPLDDQVLQSCEVVVWDKPYEKFRTVTKVSCTPVNSRERRDVPGGKKPADVNDEKIREVAHFAVDQLDAKSNSLNSQHLIEIKQAQTQTVAGTNYFLKFQLVETNCRKGTPSKSVCTKLQDKPIQECDVVVYDRPWDKHRELTSAKCESVARNRRALAGGKKPADVNDEKIREVAQFVVAQLDATSNSLNSQKLIEIKQAQTQTVAGTNYFLKLQLVETNCRKGSQANSVCNRLPEKPIQECDVVVYDRPWDKHRELTSAKCESVARNRRGVLVGGLSPADVNDERVREMADFAVAQLDAMTNSLNSQKLIEIKQAQTQVVAGTNYFLKLQLVETNCRKGSGATSTCSTPTGKPIQECDVVVYNRPWDKHREMTSSECKTLNANTVARNRRELPVGGRFPQEKDSDVVKDMAEFAVEDLNKKSNSMFKKTLAEVISAETQIVSGVNYHLKLRVVDSNCKKNDANAKNCSPHDDSSAQECEVTIWSQPWENQRTVTKSNCKDPQVKKATGGLHLVDPSAPEVLEAARLSLKTIDKGSNSVYKHALIRVIDSKVQTVSGKKYFLTLEVGESECTKNSKEENCSLRPDNSMSDRCNVVVWDQPWLGRQQVLSANCGRRSKRSVNAPVNVNSLHVAMFEEFKRKYNKVYSTEEEHQKRFRIFRANLKKIKALQDTEQGTAVYGPNMFADLSEKEFKRQYLGLKPGAAPKPSKRHLAPAQIPDVALPVEFDWRDHGAVTPVKNQGQCGSCWAFSVTGNVEGQWFLKHGKLLSLSEQELVDCDKRDDGCGGGYMTQAYEAIEELGGLETEDEYPYEAEGESCKFNKSEARATVTSSLNITTNETQIAQWLYKNGPISIGINANAMQFYMGGVSHPFKFLCSKNQLDHGVLLVGFGVHRSTIRHKILPYWLIKNSWGPRWGEKGYYRVYRGDGTCGVNQMCSSAIVG